MQPASFTTKRSSDPAFVSGARSPCASAVALAETPRVPLRFRSVTVAEIHERISFPVASCLVLLFSCRVPAPPQSIGQDCSAHVRDVVDRKTHPLIDFSQRSSSARGRIKEQMGFVARMSRPRVNLNEERLLDLVQIGCQAIHEGFSQPIASEGDRRALVLGRKVHDSGQERR